MSIESTERKQFNIIPEVSNLSGADILQGSNIRGLEKGVASALKNILPGLEIVDKDGNGQEAQKVAELKLTPLSDSVGVFKTKSGTSVLFDTTTKPLKPLGVIGADGKQIWPHK